MTSIANQPTSDISLPGEVEYMIFDDDVNIETKRPESLKKTFQSITGKTKLKKRTALTPQQIELMTEARYLENVILKFPDNSEEELVAVPEIRDQIINPNIMNLTNAEELIDDVIDTITEKKETKIKEGKAKWIYCKKDCVKSLSSQIKKEIESTAFMLRILSNSVIDTTKDTLPLKFNYINPNGEKLTGKWEYDHKFFKLVKLDPNSGRSRLIMGLGPSAAGKTFWAENVIKLMGKANENFPRSFLSIDGGLVRDKSAIYQDIVKALARHPKIDGLENLVNSGFSFLHKSLFQAGKVKKSIQKYLNTQKGDGGLPVSIYVPETLGNPLAKNDGFDKGIKPYLEITEDNNWIALYIWQGKTPEKDEKWVNEIKSKYSSLANENISAVSTTVSGKSRELDEGKKYSNKAYNTSKSHGYINLSKAPGARIDIHNSGGKYVPYPGVITEIKGSDEDKEYTIIFEGETIPMKKRKNKDIYTQGLFSINSQETKDQRNEYLNNLKVGDTVSARKEHNKSVVIEYPNAQGEFLLNQQMLNSFNSIYLQKLGKKGGRKTRRRLRHKSRKTKRRRKSRNRKTKRRRKKRKSRKR
tara:strand:+ start:124 stop:1881 length:1758 start_codon:yes stop_codon:yes gene_type:complete